MGQQQRPISDEKQLVTLGRVLQTLREEENADVLIETTLNYIQTELDYSLIWIGFYDRLDHRIVGKGGITPTGDTSFFKQRFFLNPGDLLEQVVIQQRPIGVPDLREATRAGEWRKVAQNFNIRGTLIFPIRYRDRCFGVVLMGSLQWGISPRSEEKARLSMLLGGLAASLDQIETDWQRQQTKRPEEPLLSLLEQLRSLPTMWQRLEAVVSETHKFVQPTRTNIYWFEPERRYFWRKISNRLTTGGMGDAQSSTSGITVQEAGGFYKAMLGDQIVSIGEAHSSLKADVTSRLLQRLGVRSILAAPILLQDELLGFLSVEGNEPRIWKEEEKSYVRGAAQLVALIAPIEAMEATMQQTKQDQALTAEVTQAITSEDDWQTTLKTCGEHLLSRLQAQRLMVLLFDQDQGRFEICYQSHPPNRSPIGERLNISSQASQTFFLPMLATVDWQLLERSTEAVEIEDLNSDLKLMAWREAFLEASARSLMVCNTSIGHSLEGLFLVAWETPRTWTSPERELVGLVGQQIGLILHQWHLQRQTDQQHKIYQSLQQGLTTLYQNIHDRVYPDDYERAVLQPIAQLLACPLVALITWHPFAETGRIIPGIVANHQFAINADAVVPIHTDVLIQSALAANDLVTWRIDEVPEATKQWLTGSGIGEILVIALRTAPEHETTGVVVVADQRGRYWPESAFPAFGLLVTQMAWARRYLMLATSLQSQRQQLERLNWYKHRRLEDFHRSVEIGVKNLSQLDSQEAKEVDILQSRIRQIGQQLGNSLPSVSQLLASELWQVRPMNDLGDRAYETISLTSLLRRSLERVDPLLKQRKLWSQVHDAGSEQPIPSQLNITGDAIKFELVLYEVLLCACYRAPEGGRIDIWYRLLKSEEKGVKSEGYLPPTPHSSLLTSHFLELSITDNGVADPQLVAELQQSPWDELAASTLDYPPGLHLQICQSLLGQSGGEFNLYQMEDGRVLSRLVIPIANAG